MASEMGRACLVAGHILQLPDAPVTPQRGVIDREMIQYRDPAFCAHDCSGSSDTVEQKTGSTAGRRAGPVLAKKRKYISRHTMICIPVIVTPAFIGKLGYDLSPSIGCLISACFWVAADSAECGRFWRPAAIVIEQPPQSS